MSFNRDTGEYVLAAITGGGFAWAMLEAFILGIVGACGGLLVKFLYNVIKARIAHRRLMKEVKKRTEATNGQGK